MRKSILIIAAVAALLVPLAALAVTTPASVANQICKQELALQGQGTFNSTYGTNASRSNAFGKCVAKNAANAQKDVTSAQSQCKALQADAGFAAAHNGQTFDQVYGTNSKAEGKGADENAFGKCVSIKAHQLAAAQAKSETAAAKTCKASLKADPKAFATNYGTGRSALGKCVSATSNSK